MEPPHVAKMWTGPGKNQAEVGLGWGFSSLSLSDFHSGYHIAGQSVQLRKEDGVVMQLVTVVLGCGGARDSGCPGQLISPPGASVCSPVKWAEGTGLQLL